MNLKNTPKIVPNGAKTETVQKTNSKSVKKPYEKPEIIFNNKQQMQAYLVDAVSKNKNKNFNKKLILT